VCVRVWGVRTLKLCALAWRCVLACACMCVRTYVILTRVALEVYYERDSEGREHRRERRVHRTVTDFDYKVIVCTHIHCAHAYPLHLHCNTS